MNPSSRKVNSILLAGLCLVAVLASAAPAHDLEELAELGAGNAGEESAIGSESEFDEPSARAAAASSQEDEDLAPAINPLSMADAPEEPRGLDSNIANAKVHLAPNDMATAAGHHYHHGHSVSGKMEMGAHTEKKGAFGWHAKFPVGGKGRK